MWTRRVLIVLISLTVQMALGQGAGTDVPPTRHLVSSIDVKDFGAETLRIGDLNGDGAPDLLLVQSVYGTREITCLTAITLFGEILWQMGNPSVENGRIYSDLPVQVYDWDADGKRKARGVSPRSGQIGSARMRPMGGSSTATGPAARP